MTNYSGEMTKRLHDIEKNNTLPDIFMTFRQKIYYFLFPYAKYQRQHTEQHKKTIRRLQNQRYYAKHSKQIRKNRIERYALCGE